MKPINKKEYDKVVELSNKLESHIDNALLKMIEDGEEVKLDFQVDTTHYKSLTRCEDNITISMQYIDDEGLVYDEEYELLEQELKEKLMIYWQIVKKAK